MMEMQRAMMERFQQQSQENSETLIRILEQQQKSKDKELEYLKSKDNKRRQLSQPVDVKLPEFQHSKIAATASAKGLLFYVSEWLEQLRLSIVSRLPDEITLANGSKDSAGNVFYNQFSKLT